MNETINVQYNGHVVETASHGSTVTLVLQITPDEVREITRRNLSHVAWVRTDSALSQFDVTVPPGERTRLEEEAVERRIERFGKADAGFYIAVATGATVPAEIAATVALNIVPRTEPVCVECGKPLKLVVPSELDVYGMPVRGKTRWIHMRVPTVNGRADTLRCVNTMLECCIPARLAGEELAEYRRNLDSFSAWRGEDARGTPFKSWDEIYAAALGKNELAAFWEAFAFASMHCEERSAQELRIIDASHLRPYNVAEYADILNSGVYVTQRRDRLRDAWVNTWAFRVEVVPPANRVTVTVPAKSVVLPTLHTPATIPSSTYDTHILIDTETDPYVSLPTIVCRATERKTNDRVTLITPLERDSGLYALRISAREESMFRPTAASVHGGDGTEIWESAVPSEIVGVTQFVVKNPEVEVANEKDRALLLQAAKYLPGTINWTSYAWTVPEGVTAGDGETHVIQSMQDANEGVYSVVATGPLGERASVVFRVDIRRFCIRCDTWYLESQNGPDKCRWHNNVSREPNGFELNQSLPPLLLPSETGKQFRGKDDKLRWGCCWSVVGQPGCWVDRHSETMEAPAMSDVLAFPQPKTGSAWVYNVVSSECTRAAIENKFAAGDYEAALLMEHLFNGMRGGKLRRMHEIFPDDAGLVGKLEAAKPYTEEEAALAKQLAAKAPENIHLWANGHLATFVRREECIDTARAKHTLDEKLGTIEQTLEKKLGEIHKYALLRQEIDKRGPEPVTREGRLALLKVSRRAEQVPEKKVLPPVAPPTVEPVRTPPPRPRAGPLPPLRVTPKPKEIIPTGPTQATLRKLIDAAAISRAITDPANSVLLGERNTIITDREIPDSAIYPAYLMTTLLDGGAKGSDLLQRAAVVGDEGKTNLGGLLRDGPDARKRYRGVAGKFPAGRFEAVKNTTDEEATELLGAFEKATDEYLRYDNNESWFQALARVFWEDSKAKEDILAGRTPL